MVSPTCSSCLVIPSGTRSRIDLVCPVSIDMPLCVMDLTIPSKIVLFSISSKGVLFPACVIGSDVDPAGAAVAFLS
eukprot:11755308-Heterocapsa_arctica.AAC.1